MITNLREAKAKLSQMVDLAASGEEVIITVRGKARARICPVRNEDPGPSSKEWANALEESRVRYRAQGKDRSPDTQQLWDDLRGERG
jgi:prevent-host-death family protein